VVEKAVPIESVAREFDITLPVPENTRSHGEVRQEVDRLVREYVDKKVPLLAVEKVQADAETRYALWKSGEIVDVMDRVQNRHAGRVTYDARGRLKIDDFQVPEVDFTKEIKTHVYERDCERARHEYVESTLSANLQERERLKTEVIPQAVIAVYTESKFTQIQGEWYGRNELMSLLESRRQEVVESKYKEGIRAFLQANGFEFDSSQNVWVPKEIIETKRLEQAAIEARDQARRELEEERLKKERERLSEMTSIQETVKSFLAGQPEYSQIAPFWDTKNAGEPMALWNPEGTIVDVKLASGGLATLTATLSFKNNNGVAFENRSVVFKLAKRDGRWLITEMSMEK